VRDNFQFTETNQRIGTATRDLFASWFPRIVTPIVNYSIYAMLDNAMIASFGFPKPLPLTRPLLRGALKLRGRAVRWLPPRHTPHAALFHRQSKPHASRRLRDLRARSTATGRGGEATPLESRRPERREGPACHGHVVIFATPNWAFPLNVVSAATTAVTVSTPPASEHLAVTSPVASMRASVVSDSRQLIV
jgi:hypothetical protein